MTFRVVLHSKALGEMLDAADYIAEEGYPEASRRWFDELREKLRSLESHPHRCGYAREHREGEADELRQFLFYSHRVIYCVLGEEVHILRVRHHRQDELDAL